MQLTSLSNQASKMLPKHRRCDFWTGLSQRLRYLLLALGILIGAFWPSLLMCPCSVPRAPPCPTSLLFPLHSASRNNPNLLTTRYFVPFRSISRTRDASLSLDRDSAATYLLSFTISSCPLHPRFSALPRTCYVPRQLARPSGPCHGLLI